MANERAHKGLLNGIRAWLIGVYRAENLVFQNDCPRRTFSSVSSHIVIRCVRVYMYRRQLS